MPTHIDEIADTLERLRAELEGLAVRGVRAAGPADLALLRAARDEFERIGAEHLAGRIARVVDAAAANDPAAAAALLDALVTLRLFDRVLTLDVAAQSLAALCPIDDMDERGDSD
ncbi:MAG: hypothetical protein WD066_00395 [Planctomycetaceae bacterium]